MEYIPCHDGENGGKTLTGEVLTEVMEEMGVNLVLSASIDRVYYGSDDDQKEICIDVTVDGKSTTYKADTLLVSTGRRPHVEGINLDKVSLCHSYVYRPTDPRTAPYCPVCVCDRLMSHTLQKVIYSIYRSMFAT